MHTYNNHFRPHRVQVLHPDLTFSSSFGSHGDGPGQLTNPCDVAFDRANNVHVTDFSNSRVQAFSENGEFLRQIGRKGDTEVNLHTLDMITVDNKDSLFITDRDNHHLAHVVMDHNNFNIHVE